jgi:ABC-type multidrug transport system fused ATPase/permease subunit
MRWSTIAVSVPGLLAATLITGCSRGVPVAPAAADTSCFSFAVQALHRRLMVTTVPPECSGLSHEQVNEIVDRAIRDVVGPQPKATGRREAEADSRYLADLIRPVAASAPLAAAPASQASGPTARMAALATWIITAAAGAYLLAGWLTRERRRRRLRMAGAQRAVVAAHAGLAAAGLAVWIAFVATVTPALGWIAVGMTFAIAGLGMAALLTGLPDPEAAPASQITGQPARRPPVMVIAVHGLLATATILLVLLAVIGAG